jgi:hypothetical protein
VVVVVEEVVVVVAVVEVDAAVNLEELGVMVNLMF